MMSSVLQTKTNLIKSISYPQFLELVSALSELKDSKLYAKKPNKALQNLISENLFRLLQEIESKSGLKKYGLQAAFSQSIKCQEQIVFNDDTMAIMIDLQPVLRQLYIHYFEEE